MGLHDGPAFFIYVVGYRKDLEVGVLVELQKTGEKRLKLLFGFDVSQCGWGWSRKRLGGMGCHKGSMRGDFIFKSALVCGLVELCNVYGIGIGRNRYHQNGGPD